MTPSMHVAAHPVLSLSVVADCLAASTPLHEAVRAIRKRPENVLGLLVRHLSREEIAVMEGRGCRADDWSLVQVAEDFDPFRVRRTHFVGSCILGRFRGECEVRPGISLPAGIYDSTLIDAQIGNDCLLENVRFCARSIVEHGAILFDVGSLTADAEMHYGCNQWISVGPETGGRSVPLWAGMDIAEAHAVAVQGADHEGQAAVAAAYELHVAAVSSDRSWVGRGAIVRHTTRVSNAYLGPGCVVDQATELHNVAVCCDAEHPTTIVAAALTHSMVGPGVEVCGGSIVRHTALIEHCTIDLNAVVEHSVIGANASIAKGEVTASIVGPFTGLHHQSLLIGALWPEGKGNVAYGAMVGSNHTGRAPDQEIWPGEGTFFGLGTNIKFPSDFSESPYLVIGSGVATLAQRVRYPFSLIATPIEALPLDSQVPRAYNEILPAWGLYANAYAIVRAEQKYRNRDRTGRGEVPHQVLRPQIMSMVQDAHHRLCAVAKDGVADPEAIYLDDVLPGLGKNFLRERIRRKAVEAYETVLKRYALRVLLAAAQDYEQLPGSQEVAQRLADELLPGTSFAERMQALVAIEEDNVEIVKRAKIADDQRGQSIIPGYADCHPEVDADPVVIAARERLQRTCERVQAVLAG